MIVTEQMVIDGRNFTLTYSNSGKYVVRDGISYYEALDPTEYERVYTQGDYIDNEEPTSQEFEVAGRILMGREVIENENN